MSPVQELVARLQTAGVRLALSPEGKLRVSPPGALTPDVVDTLRRHKREVFRLLADNKQTLDCRSLYQQMAEAIAADCWAIDPGWLLEHPAFYEQIRALDDKLTTMERIGASESEYRATLARLVACIRDARASCEREREAGEMARQ